MSYGDNHMVIARNRISFSLRKLTLLTSRPDWKMWLSRLELSPGYHQHIVYLRLVIMWDLNN